MYVTRYINRAVEKRWLKVYYRPVIDVKTEKLLEYEALARWDDPAYGLLQPWQFIEPAKKANLIYKVDTFILAQYGPGAAGMHETGRTSGAYQLQSVPY